MKSPGTQDIGQTNMDEIGSALRHRRDAILRRWAAVVADNRVTGAWTEEGIQLLDELIAKAEAVDSPVETRPPATSHPMADGAHRQDPMGSMLNAYRLLRQIVFEEVAADLGHDLRNSQLIALNSCLDQLMGKRVAAAAEAQCRELRAVSESQSKYMSFLSHDLRGGLNGIILMLEVMRRELEPRPEFAESVEDLALMRRSVADIVAVMERHSLAERLRRGRIQAKRRPVDLPAVIRGAIADQTQAASSKGLELIAEAPDDATIETDPELVGTILQNLTENAVKYAKRGSIHVRAERRGIEWILSVSDDGPGMPQDKLDQFLDPVRRADLKERGLGLIIAQYAARLLGGRVEGETAPERGTTVRLVLPG